MRDPCPHCGTPGKSYSRLDGYTKEIVRDTLDHPCAAFDPVPPPVHFDTDVSFIREARNSPEALSSWRQALKPKGTDTDATCGICNARVGIDYQSWTEHLQECRPEVQEVSA